MSLTACLISVAEATCVAACESPGAIRDFDLGGDVRVALDGKGGFVFAAGGQKLAFAPFELKASATGVSPTVTFKSEGDAFIAEIRGDERDFGSAAFGACSERPSAVYFGYGYYVRIDHGGGLETLYAHCSSICVTAVRGL